MRTGGRTYLVQASVKVERKLCLHNFHSSSRSLHCWPDQTACGPLGAFFRETSVLHAHALPLFAESACERIGGRLEVKSSFILNFSDSLVKLRSLNASRFSTNVSNPRNFHP